MNDLIQQIPPLLNSSDLYDKLLFIPKLNMSKSQSETERLMALDKIYDFYIPNSMTAEIYTKIYFAIYRSLKKRQQYRPLNKEILTLMQFN